MFDGAFKYVFWSVGGVFDGALRVCVCFIECWECVSTEIKWVSGDTIREILYGVIVIGQLGYW